MVSIPLSGKGLSFEDQAGALVKGFDEGVAAGDLSGSGPGGSAPGRLDAMRNMLVRAEELIAAGLLGDACRQLLDAFKRTDGASPPTDFVVGSAAGSLASEIATLRQNLGCP